jgi:hypothetical protein
VTISAVRPAVAAAAAGASDPKDGSRGQVEVDEAAGRRRMPKQAWIKPLHLDLSMLVAGMRPCPMISSRPASRP